MNLYQKIHFAFCLISLPTLLSSAANADIFQMKDGTAINGSIIKETEDSYLLLAEITNNVFAEKTILKSKVAEITKVDPSIEAYKKLASILPTRDLMSLKSYEYLMKSKVEPFLKEYPSSPHYRDAEKILDTLKKEYLLIKSGGIKLNGKLLTPAHMEADKYDVQASILEHTFMQYVKKKQYRAALSTLERLEKNHPSSDQCRDAQKVALIILPLYEEKLHKIYNEVDALLEKRRLALDRMTEDDSNRTEKIFAYEDRQYKNLLSLATTNGKQNKWLPINQYFKAPIQSNIQMIEAELKRINTASQEPTVDVGKYYRETYAALDRGDYPHAKANYDEFKKTNPSKELINELEPRLAGAKLAMERMEKLRKEEEALAKKLAAEEKARLAKEAREAARNKQTPKEKDSVLDTIKKKKEMEDKLSK